MKRIRLMTQYENLQNLMDAKASFEAAHPAVEIIIEQSADNHESLRAYQSEEAPDIIESGGWALFNRKGMFVDLHAYVNEVEGLSEDLNPGLMRIAGKDGMLPGLPVDVSLPLMLINREKFDRAGLAYPTDDWTWDEMIEMAKKLTLRDENGVATQFGLGTGRDIEEIEPYIMRNGGRYLAPDGSTAHGYVDAPATIEAFRRVMDAFRVHGVTRKPEEPSRAGDLNQGFAIVFAYTWFTGALIQHQIDDPFQVVGLPKMPGGEASNMLYMGAAGITSKSENPDLAWAFLRHYVLERPDAFRSARTLPITRSLAEKSGMAEHRLWSRYVRELANVRASGFYLSEKWNASRQLINEEIDRMILDGTDVERTLRSWTRFA